MTLVEVLFGASSLSKVYVWRANKTLDLFPENFRKRYWINACCPEVCWVDVVVLCSSTALQSAYMHGCGDDAVRNNSVL